MSNEKVEDSGADSSGIDEEADRLRFAEIIVEELSDYEDDDELSQGDESDEVVEEEVAEVVDINAQQELERSIEHNVKVITVIIQGSSTVLLYPFQLARTLMQVGYEPVQPIPSVTLFRRPCLLLPNVFSYLKYIKSVDGLLGCYRGLVPYLLFRGMHVATYQACAHLSEIYFAIPGVPNSPYGSRQDRIDERAAGDYSGSPANVEGVHQEGEFRTYLRDMSLDMVWRGAAITVSYPLQVVAIHSMVAFIGREPELSKGVFGIVKAIWKCHGAYGFFKGLIPRLVGEGAAAVAIGLLTYIIKVRLSAGLFRTLLRLSTGYLTGALTYSFNVVSTTMAVNGGCSEVGSNELFGPFFSSWTECYNYLQQHGQLRRGSNIIWRYYTGPTKNYHGIIRPSPFIYFGPNHSRTYKYL